MPVYGRQVVDPASFHYVDRCGQSIFDLLMAIPDGFVAQAKLITMCLIVGAYMNLITASGAINVALGNAIKGNSGKKKASLLVLVFGIGLLLGLRGGAESLLPYVAIAVSVAIALGYDSFVGFGCLMFGGYCGFATNWIGTNYIVSAGIAGLDPLMQDVWYRVIVLLGAIALVAIYFRRYLKKIDGHLELSAMHEEDKNFPLKLEVENVEEFTAKHKIILAFFILSIVGMIVGAMKFKWSLPQFSAYLFATSIIVALIDRLDGETFCKNFMNGAKAMVFPVVLIGCAKGVSIILTNGKVLDTISYGIANAVSGLPVALSASAMFLAHCLINILIPSASGQAAATLPIMIPVGDLIGLDRHISVLAFQFGDCLTNALTPTSAVLMAGLGIAGISWVDINYNSNGIIRSLYP